MDDRKLVKKYVQYQDWVERMEKKGIPLSKTTEMYSQSYERFKARYSDLQRENTFGNKNFEGGILKEMERRSFKTGSVKQAEFVYENVKDSMRRLKYSKDPADQELYDQLNEEFDFENLVFNASEQIRTGKFYGSDDAILKQMIDKFTAFGVTLNWNSPN